MKEYSGNAFFVAVNLLKPIRYFEEECYTQNQLLWPKEGKDT